MIAVNDNIRAKVEALPACPGVYRWKDKNGKVIYVGKAVNLKNRVRSYVREDKNRSPKVAAMMRHAEDLDITMTGTEMEALILECSLIKELHPKYNISLRDDKSYPYLKITKEEWPRMFITRNIKREDGAHYFGPFTDVGGLKETLRLLRAEYPIRTCRSMKVERPCLQYHLGYCAAPCCGLCTKEAYAEIVRGICDIFEGRSTALATRLKKEMEAAAENLDFETAAKLRDRLLAVKSVQQRQHIVAQAGDFDVIGLSRDGRHTALEIFYIRYGRMIGKENYSIPEMEGETDAALLAGFLKEFYGADAVSVPKEILVPELPEDAALLADWLGRGRAGGVHLYVPERGFKKRLTDMAAANAAKYLADKKLQWEYREARESAAPARLKELLHLPQLPERMECFDISHNQGAETVASMVVFEGGRPAKSEYRKFKLQTTQGAPDDFKSMAEIMARRYGGENDWPKPDLIVLDGGAGQLHAALPIIRKCGITAPVIGLAKRMEEIYTEASDTPVLLDPHEPALLLLQSIRDEAHRFGIAYHRKWTVRRNAESLLDHVPGIGATRRNALWRAFRSLDEMEKAGVEELSRVKGMNRMAAEALYRFLHMTKDEKQNFLANGDVKTPEGEPI